MSWTSPRTWVSGELVTASMLNLHVRDDLLYLYGIRMTDYASYTPTWGNTGTANALGNGTITGQWAQSNKFTHYKVELTLGSTSTVGNGTQYVTLPAASNSSTDIDAADALMYDSSPSTYYPGRAIKVNAQASQMQFLTTAGALVSQTVPFTWASGDRLAVNGVFRAA